MRSGIFLRKELPIILLIFSATFVYFPEMFFFQQGFYSGDHRLQHYPWATFYAEQLRQFKFPWWTSYFHCGFPLLAEGQVGAFYPFNLFFYFLFPVKIAYSYGILFHYFLGGAFFYFYVKKLPVSSPAAFFGTLIYLFGTSQGGYYYNIISLKVLVWLPLTFYLSDGILQERRKRWIPWLGLVFAFQVFGGYLQYALYSIAFSALYYLFRVCQCFHENRSLKNARQGLSGFLAAVLIMAAVAMPQLGSTLELARFSNRYSYPEEFAYVGSFNPLALATLFFPHWDGFLRAEIYIGMIGLFFFLIALFMPKSKTHQFFILMLLLAFGLSLGKYNPLYVLLIKITHISSFRVPTKFLFFTGYAMAVLSSLGLDYWKNGEGRHWEKVSGKAWRGFFALSVTAISGWILSNVILRIFEVPIKSILKIYLQNYFIKSPVHSSPLEDYFHRLDLFYDSLLQSIRLANPWNLLFAGIIAATLFWLARLRLSRKRNSKANLTCLFFLLYANLYVYGWTSVKGNYESYASIHPSSEIAAFLKQSKDLFRVYRGYVDHASVEAMPLSPHMNMLDHVSITGAYSPLIMKEYYDLMSGLGDVNDSNHAQFENDEVLSELSALINFLNVRYLILDHPLPASRYRYLMTEGNYFLYENSAYLPRAFFVTRSGENSQRPLELLRSKDFSPSRKVYLNSSPAALDQEGIPEYFQPARFIFDNQDEVLVAVSASSHGFLVMSDIFYPGWKVKINGAEGKILPVNGLFRGVEIPEKGDYRILFSYNPVWRKMAGVSLLAGLAAFLSPLGMMVYKRNQIKCR